MNYIPKTDITGQRLELDFNDMFLKTGDPSSNERMQAVQNIKSYSELFKTSGNPFTRDHKDDNLAPVHSRQEKENESGLRKDRSLPIFSQAQEANYDHSTASKKESGIGKDHSLPILSTVDKADRERHQNAQKSQYYALARRASNGNRLLPLRDTGRHNRSPNHTPFFSPIMGHKATGNKVVYRPPAFRHSHGIASDGETEHTESQQIATPVPLAHKEQLPIHNSSQNRIVSKTNASAMLEKGDRVGERFANLGKAIRPGYNIPMGSADIFSSAGPFSSSTPLTYVKPTAGKAVQSRVPSLRPGYESNSDADDTYDFSRSLSSSLSALSTSQSSRSSSLAENSMDSRLLEGEQEILMEDAEADLMDLKSLPPANPYGQNFLVSEEVSDSESSDSSPEKGDVTMTESRFETGYLLKPRYVSGVPVPPFLPSSVYMTDIVKRYHAWAKGNLYPTGFTRLGKGQECDCCKSHRGHKWRKLGRSRKPFVGCWAIIQPEFDEESSRRKPRVKRWIVESGCGQCRSSGKARNCSLNGKSGIVGEHSAEKGDQTVDSHQSSFGGPTQASSRRPKSSSTSGTTQNRFQPGTQVVEPSLDILELAQSLVEAHEAAPSAITSRCCASLLAFLSKQTVPEKKAYGQCGAVVGMYRVVTEWDGEDAE